MNSQMGSKNLFTLFRSIDLTKWTLEVDFDVLKRDLCGAIGIQGTTLGNGRSSLKKSQMKEQMSIFVMEEAKVPDSSISN